MSAKGAPPAPEVIAYHFTRQYYHEVMAKRPSQLYKFYKEESLFSFSSGAKREAPPARGPAEIQAKMDQIGLAGAIVDLECASTEAKTTKGGGILLKTTGVITISGMQPREFCQTMSLSRQRNITVQHAYFVREDAFHFKEAFKKKPKPEAAESLSRKDRRAVEKAVKDGQRRLRKAAREHEKRARLREEEFQRKREEEFQRKRMDTDATSLTRSAALARTRIGAQKGIWRWLLACVLFFAMLSTALLLASSRSPLCGRGDAFHSGDRALVPGECIAGATGSRHFGWLPCVSWKPTLVVGDGGELIATRPDGTRVALGGDTSTEGRKHGFLSRVFAAPVAAPARGSFEARLDRLRRRGGHVGFTEGGDLYVADSAGRMVWSLAEEVEGEGV